VPYHHPVILAKRLATLDVLSKGRMRLLTVGVGALPGEAMAVGVDFATRGRRADEARAPLSPAPPPGLRPRRCPWGLRPRPGPAGAVG